MFVSVKNHSQNTFSLFFVFFLSQTIASFIYGSLRKTSFKNVKSFQQILEALARLLPLLIKGAITQFNKAL